MYMDNKDKERFRAVSHKVVVTPFGVVHESEMPAEIVTLHSCRVTKSFQPDKRCKEYPAAMEAMKAINAYAEGRYRGGCI